MSERKAWSEQEDRALRSIFEERGVRRWAEIARVMEAEFGLTGRTGKQCRERYHNHLDNTIRRDKWLPQEENDLIALHDAMGNRWADISRAIPGRAQNCVKNKFYSIVRRGLRYLNAAIKRHLKKYKEIDIAIAYRLVEACEVNYRRKHPTKQMQNNFEIKKQIIHYGTRPEPYPASEEEYLQVKHLIEQIKLFAKGKPSDNSETTIPEPPKPTTTSPHTRKVSLESILADHPEEKPPQSKGRVSSDSISPALSKHISNFSNCERISNGNREREGVGEEAPPINSTIKSFELPFFEEVRSPQQIIMIESSHFDQLHLRGSHNSWSHLYHN